MKSEEISNRSYEARRIKQLTSCSLVPSAVLKIKTRVPLVLAVANNAPLAVSAIQASDDSWACTNFVLFELYNSTLTSPLLCPGHARTQEVEADERAHSPVMLLRVSIWWRTFKFSKLYTYILCSKTTTMRSRRSFTALTALRKESSPMHLLWKSSQIMTLLGEYWGFFPPPTRANTLHLNSISTMAIPAPLVSLRKVSLNGSQL